MCLKILDLVLKSEWYDMIASGKKREEYREIKPYWTKRLMEGDDVFKGFTHVRFRKGYTKESMLYSITGFEIGRGNVEWGAPSDKDVYIIKLSELNVQGQLNAAAQGVINDVAKDILSGNEVTTQLIADKITEALRKVLCDDNLNFTLKGDMNDFNLVPADEHTKYIFERFAS